MQSTSSTTDFLHVIDITIKHEHEKVSIYAFCQ